MVDSAENDKVSEEDTQLISMQCECGRKVNLSPN
eukprot:CAMPEP_0185036134 /NCGR_PEP_ID=MMETSP1103-20130426/28655_1 /TAXON_ID=36769 /ORGANISM="Paraphysomonas bandaiensis, Strain Caron Lab Isolate" /LENGTH=33 /DNA_ID= /DNA_START= /DNA_END= /DNA_ORIENTATION=